MTGALCTRGPITDAGGRAARPRSVGMAVLSAALLGPIGMLYSTLLGCAITLLGGGLLAVAYVASDNPWDTTRYGFAGQHAMLAPAMHTAIAVYWLTCIAWAAIAAKPSILRHPSRTDHQT